MNDLQEIKGMLEVVLRELAGLKQQIMPKEGPLTICAFARRVGMSRWTIQRRIKAGEIRTVGGRVPSSELQRFL